LENIGISEVIISLNKNQVKVKDFLDSKNLELKISYVFEDTACDSDKLGAIGALKFVVDKFGADDYFVLGADNYTQGLDYNEMLSMHEENKADATIALFELSDITKVPSFGIGVIDDNDRIVSFQEKPKVEEAKSMLASTFIYVMSKNFLCKHLPEYVRKELKACRKPDNMGDLWAHFARKLKIFGHVFSGYWGDVGSPLPYVEINHRALDAIKRRIHEGVKLRRDVKILGKVIIEKGVNIDENVTIIGPCIIGKNVKIKQGSIIGPYTTLLRDVKIGKNNIIAGSILFENSETNNKVKITRAIIDGDCVINEDNRIEEQAMIGYSCCIDSHSQILYNTKLWPFLTVDKNSILNGKIYYELENMIHEPRIKKSCYWK